MEKYNPWRMGEITPGDILAHRFEVLKLLGTGGMAEVFLARDQSPRNGFPEQVVIKRILPHLAREADFVHMFNDEARICLRLLHRNIAQVYETIEHEGVPHLVMEHIDGMSFLDWAVGTKGAELQLDVIGEMVIQACRGLEHAHCMCDEQGHPMGIVHRDISPQNLMIDSEGLVKIIDFGVAKAAIRTDRTRTGVLKGKYPYMAPERIKGLPGDLRSDVFALGVVAFELTTRRRLFWRSSDYQTLHAIVSQRVPAMGNVRKGVPELWDVTIRRALNKRPDQRYQSTTEMAEAVRRAMDRLGIAPDRKKLAEQIRSIAQKKQKGDAQPVEDTVSKAMAIPQVDELLEDDGTTELSGPQSTAEPQVLRGAEAYQAQNWQAGSEKQEKASYRLPDLPQAPLLGVAPENIAGCFAYAAAVMRMVGARRKALAIVEQERGNLEKERAQLFQKIGVRLHGIADQVDRRLASRINAAQLFVPQSDNGPNPMAREELVRLEAQLPSLSAAVETAPQGTGQRQAAEAMLVFARQRLEELRSEVAVAPSSPPAGTTVSNQKLFAELGRAAWQSRAAPERANDLYRGLDRCKLGLETCREETRIQKAGLGEFERRPVAVAVLSLAIPLICGIAVTVVLALGTAS